MSDASPSDATVKPIDADTVHRICSDQVITNLSSAVKELVENSLDAGATTIEVRATQFGSEVMEVVDNGKGIHPADFDQVALKHTTSKLRDFGGLETLLSFGFRGEALSSLCGGSKVTMVTRHASQPLGTMIEFDTAGGIAAREAVAREVGTTISIQAIFQSLPVRR